MSGARSVRRLAGLFEFLLLAAAVLLGSPILAQDAEEKTSPWSNETELSLVLTEGNSGAETFGFKNTLKRTSDKGIFRLLADGVRSDTADDRFVIIEPGLTWLPGESPPVGFTQIVDPPVEPDVERYFVEGRYDQNFGKSRQWHVGTSWERNEDAGIVNRYIAFSGLGNVWRDDEKMRFTTAYGLSYTDREEDTPDPEKEDQFAGVRLSWDFKYLFGMATTYENNFISNLSLADTSDYSLNMTNSVGVNIAKRVALKVSLQFLYESEPALEEVDVKAFVEIVDPDGMPGSGDEYFQSLSSGAGEVIIGETDIRKKELDTIFRTSLVIDF